MANPNLTQADFYKKIGEEWHQYIQGLRMTTDESGKKHFRLLRTGSINPIYLERANVDWDKARNYLKRSKK